MGKILHVRPFKRCPECGKKGFRATYSKGRPVTRCKYCGYEVVR